MREFLIDLSSSTIRIFIQAEKYEIKEQKSYTKIAGRTLATFFEREQKAFVVVTLNEGNDWNVHKFLANEIESRYELATLVQKGKHTKGNITINVPEDIQALVPKNSSETFRHIVKISRHPDSKRAVWHVYTNDQLLVTKLVEKK